MYQWTLHTVYMHAIYAQTLDQILHNKISESDHIIQSSWATT